MPAPNTSNTPEDGSPMPPAIVDPYLKIQAALFNETMDGVKANAGSITTAATSLGAPAFQIGTTAAQLTSAIEVADAREKFSRLSDVIITYMDGLKLTPPGDVQVVSCEATRRQWLQEGSAVSNPYDPASNCGSFR
jgi:hypothetical protein